MKLTEYTIESLTPFIISRVGKDLVRLFNTYGILDKYDYDNGGLPDIGKKNGQRPSKTQYVEKRLNDLSGKPELRDLLNQVLNELQNPAEAIPQIDRILMKENFHLSQIDGKYFIEGGIVVKPSDVINDAHFLNIQNQILAVLDSAKVSIVVAMAWFTNEVLFDKLLEKFKEGVDIQVVIFNDGINSKYGVEIEKLPHFKIRGTRGGFMHNKFAVIDNQIVITGSYNWSTNAETKNNENITILHDPTQATKFSVEFKKLISKDK